MEKPPLPHDEDGSVLAESQSDMLWWQQMKKGLQVLMGQRWQASMGQ